MTTGAMRHYFDGHEGLQRAAMAAMLKRVGERMRVAGAIAGSVPERAARVLRELLPLDEERQAEAEVWFAFLAAARFDETFRPLADESYDTLRALMQETVSALRPTARAAERELETERLFALVDGLALHAVQRRGAAPPAPMAVVLDAHLAALTSS